MSSGDIFYSNVDVNLRKELNARANAGFTSKTNADLNYMLGKVAGVEIFAYDGNDPATKQIVQLPGQGGPDPFATIGGGTNKLEPFLPNGPTGYLRPGSSRRVPPLMTLAEINIGDHSMGLLNKATVNITIPDPARDFDAFERIWFRPGRHVTLIYEHPDSAVITGELLTDSAVPSTDKLEKQFPKKTDTIRNQLKKMNRMRFDGLITSFQFTYQQDGSVECTLSMTGTSNVYTEVSMLIQQDTGSAGDGTNIGNQTFYGIVNKFVNGTLNKFNNDNITAGGANIDKDTTDRSILFGPGFKQNQVTEAQQSTYRYITVGLFIMLINENIIKKNTAVNNPLVICNDTVCKSNVFDEIVSADPRKLLLYAGKETSATTDAYGSLMWMNEAFKNSDTLGFFGNDENGVLSAFPSRIYIEMDVIKFISENAKTVNDLFKSLSELIYSHTGGSINMSLISHPEYPDALLYYDTKFLGDNKEDVSEFVVPMFAQSKVEKNSNETVLGTIVSDVKISSKLPDNMKNLAYVLNEGTEISESDIAPFVAYMYADADQREKIGNNYKETHKKHLAELVATKLEFAKDPTSKTTIDRLKKALIKYIQYPTKDIILSNKLSAPIYPFDVEFTIDGINGFRYGDVLEIPILPSRYSEQTVFSVIQVIQTVDSTGLWKTKIKCIMRPRITN